MTQRRICRQPRVSDWSLSCLLVLWPSEEIVFDKFLKNYFIKNWVISKQFFFKPISKIENEHKLFNYGKKLLSNKCLANVVAICKIKKWLKNQKVKGRFLILFQILTPKRSKIMKFRSECSDILTPKKLLWIFQPVNYIFFFDLSGRGIAGVDCA